MANRVKGIPDNSSVLIPRLVCRDPAAAVDFMMRTFNAASLNQRPGPDGKLAHALLTDQLGHDHGRSRMANADEPRTNSGRQLPGGPLRVCRGR